MTNIYDNVFWLWLQPMSWCQKRVGLWLKLQAAAWISFAFSQTLPKWPLVGHLIFLCLKEIENNTSKWNENTFLSYSDIVRIKSISLQKHSDISMRRAAEGPITSTLLLEVTVCWVSLQELVFFCISTSTGSSSDLADTAFNSHQYFAAFMPQRCQVILQST